MAAISAWCSPSVKMSSSAPRVSALIRIDVEDRPVGLDRLRQVAHVVLVDLAHAVLQGDDVRLVRR